MTKTLALLLPLFLSTSCLRADAGAQNVDPKAAQSLIAEQKAIVIDIRTPEEFEEGHIPGAKNIDFFGKTFRAQLGALDKNAPVVMHCQSGGRSSEALPVFKELGFTKLYHLKAGFGGWKKAGLPVEK